MKRKVVNPDLAEERAKCTFDKAEVSQALADEYTLKMFKSMAEEMKKHPELLMTKDWFDMSREEQMKYQWEKTFQWFKHDPERFFYNNKSEPYLPFYFLPGVSPLLLHYGMFISSIERLGSDE